MAAIIAFPGGRVPDFVYYRRAKYRRYIHKKKSTKSAGSVKGLGIEWTSVLGPIEPTAVPADLRISWTSISAYSSAPYVARLPHWKQTVQETSPYCVQSKTTPVSEKNASAVATTRGTPACNEITLPPPRTAPPETPSNTVTRRGNNRSQSQRQSRSHSNNRGTDKGQVTQQRDQSSTRAAAGALHAGGLGSYRAC